MSELGMKPSSWFSNSNMVLCTSLSPAFSLSNLLVPADEGTAYDTHCQTMSNYVSILMGVSYVSGQLVPL